jgi:hypothetical protein
MAETDKQGREQLLDWQLGFSQGILDAVGFGQTPAAMQDGPRLALC